MPWQCCWTVDVNRNQTIGRRTMSITSATQIDNLPAVVRRITGLYANLLLAGFALLPAFLIAYLYYFQDAHLTFESHSFHEIAISAATLEGLFVSYVTWQCYRSSGEPLL